MLSRLEFIITSLVTDVSLFALIPQHSPYELKMVSKLFDLLHSGSVVFLVQTLTSFSALLLASYAGINAFSPAVDVDSVGNAYI